MRMVARTARWHSDSAAMCIVQCADRYDPYEADLLSGDSSIQEHVCTHSNLSKTGSEHSEQSRNLGLDEGSEENLEIESPKRKVARKLYQDKGKEASSSHQATNALSFPIANPLYASLPKLLISQISNTKLRFAFEGKVLNVYGTFDSDRDYRKYLKSDLVDKVGFGTITLVIGPEYIKKCLEKIKEGAFLRVEGPVVLPHTPFDGGSADYSLHVDATTNIVKAEAFEATVFFVPEISIRAYLAKAVASPSLKATIAFVIIQVDKVEKHEGGVYEQLTIADGPSALDRATLTFVNKKKTVYHQLVEEFQKGNIIPYVARNVGVWKAKSNTLSILDVTLVFPLIGERRKAELQQAFYMQISELGYGKEVYGTFEVTNFNGSLLLKKCAACKSPKVNTLPEGGFCFPCGKVVEVLEFIKLEGQISQLGGPVIDVTLEGDAVNKVVLFEDSLLNMFKRDSIMTRIALSEISVVGSFLVDNQGQIIGFRTTPAA